MAALAVPQQAAAQALNPKQVPKFVNTLPNPLTPTADPTSRPPVSCGNRMRRVARSYTLQVQQFQQSLGLGAAVPPTTVWGYGKTGQPGTFPGRTFELQRGTPITVTYVNSLANGAGSPAQPDAGGPDARLGQPGCRRRHHSGAPGHPPARRRCPDPARTATPTPGARPSPTRPRRSTSGAPVSSRAASTPCRTTTTTLRKPAPSGTTTTRWASPAPTCTWASRATTSCAMTTRTRCATANVLPSYPYEVPIVIQDREFTSTGQLFYPAGVNPGELPPARVLRPGDPGQRPGLAQAERGAAQVSLPDAERLRLALLRPALRGLRAARQRGAGQGTGAAHPGGRRRAGPAGQRDAGVPGHPGGRRAAGPADAERAGPRHRRALRHRSGLHRPRARLAGGDDQHRPRALPGRGEARSRPDRPHHGLRREPAAYRRRPTPRWSLGTDLRSRSAIPISAP
ncbi:MAG: hypothetical protein MZW92_76365 [Comamonadaceae bacterium]|nr:hypothetical protein [Comamonadaceae bacterium]